MTERDLEPGVVVMGTDAVAVAERVAELRESGRRAAGLVGDDLAAAEAMAAELFGETATVVPATPPPVLEEESRHL